MHMPYAMSALGRKRTPVIQRQVALGLTAPPASQQTGLRIGRDPASSCYCGANPDHTECCGDLAQACPIADGAFAGGVWIPSIN